MLNDMSWLMFLGIISSACVQVAALGLAILLDKRTKPVFPRWAGYFNIWVALIWVPAAIIPFFKTGPLAWNGVFAWWVPLCVVLLLVRRDDRSAAACDRRRRARTARVGECTASR